MAHTTVKPVLLLGLLAWLSGCAVGPNFKRPALPASSDYGSASTPAETASAPGTGGNAQQLIAGRDIPAGVIRNGVQLPPPMQTVASSICFMTWSMLKLDGFCRGGNSLKVSMNFATRSCVGTPI